jgi:hypothetical protein
MHHDGYQTLYNENRERGYATTDLSRSLLLWAKETGLVTFTDLGLGSAPINFKIAVELIMILVHRGP